MNRYLVFGAAATIAVASAVVLGFLNLGSPARQREIAADQERSHDLQTISYAVSRFYATDKRLPADLNSLTAFNAGLRLRDPVTNAVYEYKPTGETQFQLCATFMHASSGVTGPTAMQQAMFAVHGSGRQCFPVDAVRTTLFR